MYNIKLANLAGWYNEFNRNYSDKLTNEYSIIYWINPYLKLKWVCN